MKKNLSKLLAALLLIGSVMGAVPAMAAGPVPPPETVAAGDGMVTPMADQFDTYYRTLNGVLQYRIWNVTQGYWIMPWTNC